MCNNAIDHHDPEIIYELNGNKLETSKLEKDLGVWISDDLKPAHHIGQVTAKANKILGLIKRNFTYSLQMKRCVRHYTVPHLEYAVQSWMPYYQKDRPIVKVEKIQRATKLVPELKELPYEEQYKRLGLTSLERMRLREDLTETFRILHGHENIDNGLYFEISEVATRPNSCKLKKREHWRMLTRANSFCIRVVSEWNALPEEIVMAPNVSTFKQRLDKHWEDDN